MDPEGRRNGGGGPETMEIPEPWEWTLPRQTRTAATAHPSDRNRQKDRAPRGPGSIVPDRGRAPGWEGPGPS